MTAGDMTGDREACIEAGMDDYISKPIKPLDLQMALRRTIDALGDLVPTNVSQAKLSSEPY
jgi:CheY-like chemotaxis protein